MEELKANPSNIHISVVSPVYRGAAVLQELAARIAKAVSPITEHFEIILVDDYSPDASWEVISALALQDERIKGVKLSRNFGQHYAITAGLDHASGEWVFVLDCDLQDRPEEIPALYEKAQEGWDVVLGKRTGRQDTLYRRIVSRIFFGTLSYLSGTEYDAAVGNFGIYNWKIVSVICSMRESIRSFPTMVKWAGFKQTAIPIQHASRTVGKSNYNFKRMFNLALDVILAYSDKPIRMAISTGFVTSLLAVLFAVATVARYLLGKIEVPGYASIIVSIWFLSGLLMMTLGIVGLYVGKTFEGVKRRPIYVVEAYADAVLTKVQEQNKNSSFVIRQAN